MEVWRHNECVLSYEEIKWVEELTAERAAAASSMLSRNERCVYGGLDGG